MFALTGISATRYRSFAQTLEIQLRPLTLLYGRNNAGKSAVLRLLPILSDSVIDGADSPFNISRVAGDGASFRDVVNRGSPLKRITLTLEWAGSGGEIRRDTFQLKYSDEADAVIVTGLDIAGAGGESLLSAEADPYPDHALFRVTASPGEATQIQPDFMGLVPSSGTGIQCLEELRDRLIGLRRNIQWLQSVRAHWHPLVTKSGSRPRVVEPDGSDAPKILLTDDRVLTEVAGWYASPTIRRRLEVIDAAVGQPMHRILLNPQSGQLRSIDLLDTGEGMIQVFPVLIACALARERGRGHLLAIEEPESHLHGNAQQALADHFCGIATGANAPTIVIETHSRILMLGVQIAIAEGRMDPDRCCAYWIDQEDSGESTAIKVEFDEYGRPIGGWPRSAFEEDQALARRLLDRQLQGGAFD